MASTGASLVMRISISSAPLIGGEDAREPASTPVRRDGTTVLPIAGPVTSAQDNAITLTFW